MVFPVPAFSFESALNIILAVVGIVLAILLYFKALDLKLPSFQSYVSVLIGSKSVSHPAIKVTMNGTAVDHLSVEHLVFWNAGRKTIVRQDVVSLDPPRIILNGAGRMLLVEIVKATRPANQCTVALDLETNEALIDFDYLDHQDGVIVRVFHTSQSRTSVLEVTGTLRGAKPIRDGYASLARGERIYESFTRKAFWPIDKLPHWMIPSRSDPYADGFLIGVARYLVLTVVLLPVTIIYIPVAIAIFFFVLFGSVTNEFRYSIPKELRRYLAEQVWHDPAD